MRCGSVSNLDSKSSHLRVEPAGDGVTEEDEVRDNSSRVHADHLTHPPERGVLLVVVSDVPEWERLCERKSTKVLQSSDFFVWDVPQMVSSAT